ncbi:hypothetical protein FisN_31Hh066 [Fistulifera solaris]|uniref:Uncharacterized protein n=1 Tax=Fistulifera solaris TaxID=1519565 RepID=A0A1Z5JAL2_FISSO|nr:hypothetical protein FisN_31Hh066 [Fistulifera solaris]|eukprot:GAX10858.1 hypothetical protein FisN_31Hh066 [Fistulifera solaris]
MSRSSKSKNKRAKKQEAQQQQEEAAQQEEVVVVETVETVVETTITTVEENEHKEDEPVDNKEDIENAVDENHNEEEEASSKKRSAEEMEGFDLGKVVGQIVHSVGSFFQQFWGSQPAEPAEGPPSIDQTFAILLLGDATLESALWEVVNKEGPLQEFKKDLAFETRHGDTTTVHSVRLQLYHGLQNPEDEEETWPTPLPSVETLVLVLPDPSLVEKWIRWIRPQFPNEAIVLLLTGAPPESDWHCQDVQSWHCLSSSESPHHVASMDDLLYSLVERHFVDDEPAAKRRKVDPATVADNQE